MSRHGTNNGYKVRGCRCEACVMAHDLHVAKRLAGGVPHGTWNVYSNLGCRCNPCRQAAREHKARRRHRSRKPPMGFYDVRPIQERIAYLVRCGESAKQLAIRIGVPVRQVERMKVRTTPLRADAADRWAIRLGTMPELLWPEWNDIDEEDHELAS